jgi:DNA-binding CsgD family transcriptional regulator
MNAERTVPVEPAPNAEVAKTLLEIEQLLVKIEKEKSGNLDEGLATRLATIEEKLGKLETLVGAIAPQASSTRVDELVERIIASRIKSDLESSLVALRMVQSYLREHDTHRPSEDPDERVRDRSVEGAAGSTNAATAAGAVDETAGTGAVVLSGAAVPAPVSTDSLLALTGPAYRDALALLSRRKREVLEQLLMGKSNRDIASALGVTEKTVKNNLYHMYQILRVKSRAQLIRRLLDPYAERETVAAVK